MIGLKGLPIRKLDTSGIKSNINYKNSYKFRAGTEEFFGSKAAVWEKALESYKGKPDIRYLEIGVFEGQSCLWMLENVLTHPTARMTGIDPFLEGRDVPGKSSRDIFYSNLKLSGLEEKVEVIEGFSQIELHKLPLESFDIIYIDGSHDATDCLEDAVLSWRLLRAGGILIFDDYQFFNRSFLYGDKPKIAIDTFMGLFGKHFDIVHTDWQVILRRKTKA
jgi:hypothetical protein